MKKLASILLFALCLSVFSEEDADITIDKIDDAVGADTIRPQNDNDTDSTDIDTIDTTEQLRDSLFNHLNIQEAQARERSFDNAVLFSPFVVRRQHFFGDDLFNWTDVLQRNPNFVSVYYSPDFPLNRALFRGYLIPVENAGLLNRLYSPTLPVYYYDLLEIKEFEILPDGSINPVLFTGKTITPEVYFAWQGGLFDGNMLKFRMMRNLSKNLSLSAFISHSDLKRMQFYHGGGVAQLYQTYHSDLTKISIRGNNPFSYNNRSGMTFNYENNFRANVRYSYADIRQDLAFHTDSILLTDTLYSIAYSEARNYLHQIDATLEFPFGERFLWRNLGKIESAEQREYPISRIQSGKFITDNISKNKTLQSAGMQFLFAPVPNDTISIQYAVNRFISETSSVIDTVSHHTRIIAENKFISPNADRITLTTNGGIEFLKTNARDTRKYPAYSANADFKFGNFRTQLYSKLELIPATHSYRPQFEKGFIYMRYNESYNLNGINLHYQFPVASIHGGYSYMIGGESYNNFWQRLPYYQSEFKNVFSAGGSLGQIGIISMFSNWFFSDKLPTFKSYSGLRFHFNQNGQTRHFYTDITYNYWSKRDIYFWYGFGDYMHWNRPIHDISLKLAAEIETFRVFWKIDNILNRTNSYVPGYIMPGLIFRWGFSWNILG